MWPPGKDRIEVLVLAKPLVGMADMAFDRHDRLTVGEKLDTAGAVRARLACRWRKSIQPEAGEGSALPWSITSMRPCMTIKRTVLPASIWRRSRPARASGWCRAAARPACPFARTAPGPLTFAPSRPAPIVGLDGREQLAVAQAQRQERAEVAFRAGIDLALPLGDQIAVVVVWDRDRRT